MAGAFRTINGALVKACCNFGDRIPIPTLSVAI